MSSLTADPDERALLYVMQWMHERGLHQALEALECQSGVMYDETTLEKASSLMQLVWQEVEQELAEVSEDDVEIARRAEKERLLSGGLEDYAQTRTSVIEGAHPANIICCKLVPGMDQVLTGSGDGVVRMLSLDGDLLWSTPVGAGAVLSLDTHPRCNSGLTPLILASSMAGSIHVLHGISGSILASAQPHTKYAVRARWSAGGAYIASGSHDQTIVLQHVTVVHGGDENGMESEAEGGMVVVLEQLKQLPLSTIVTDLLFLDTRLLVATRDTHVLRVWQLPQAEEREVLTPIDAQHTASLSSTSSFQDGTAVSSSAQPQVPAGSLHELPPINLNERGDAHVSFSARALALSPAPNQSASSSDTAITISSTRVSSASSKPHQAIHAASASASAASTAAAPYLLVATDSPRVLVLRTSDWSHLAVLFGPPVDAFFNPAVAWHRDEHYVYCIGPGAEVLVFHVGSGRVVSRLKDHHINVRGLDYDPHTGRLATCSFDKTLCIYSPLDGGHGLA